jgi:hypothetical protein
LDLDVDSVLAGLKSFQRATVDRVTARFLDPVDPSPRFLVADEVGLGKTDVARGVIARLLDARDRAGAERIEIVYVCSNATIAQQNINKLNVLGSDAVVEATRLTLLPLQRARLSTQRANLLSITPGTSFELRSTEGIAKERAVLFRMLQQLWDHRAFVHRVPVHAFRGWSSYERFLTVLDNVDGEALDPELVEAFRGRLEAAERACRAHGQPTLRERFDDVKDRWRRRKFDRREDRDARATFVGELRGLLMDVCVNALQPDLVILDEFQRFKHVLDPQTVIGEVAHSLFNAPGTRVLLLSATPYRMYSTAHESRDRHYDDFIATYRFLAADEAAQELGGELGRFRSALLEVPSAGVEPVRRAKAAVESRLRRVMSRTERLAVRDDRDGMLTSAEPPELRVESTEVGQFVALDRLARDAGVHGTLEYWKAAPYLLNFMDNYVFARRLRQTLAHDPEQLAALDQAGALLPVEELRRFRSLDPDSARIRSLLADTVGRGAWRWLWIAPTAPHYRLEPPFDDVEAASFTKRLVFSGWQVVPKALAALASYEAERQMMSAGGEPGENTAEARARHPRLLQFDQSNDRYTGMPVLALLYPSSALSRLADPAQMGGPDTALSDVRSAVKDHLGSEIAALCADHEHPAGVDTRWYWAAPLLLDQRHHPDATEAWWSRRHLATLWREATGDPDDQEDSGWWAKHVERGRQLLAHELRLGAPPADLDDVLTDLGLGAPGVCALRALDRVTDVDDLLNPTVRDTAGRIASGFRTLFNLREVTAMVRSFSPEAPYWRACLTYARNGGLQAVLDEYAHLLRDWLGVADASDPERVDAISAHMREALAIRATPYRVHDPHRASNGDVPTANLRGRFALRFGDDRADSKSQALHRQSQVRAAFNSPFWPFVLATTSVGQEGLDFHHYCHAVVHWNLPGNPVDLEQREGRVHRYKGHAIRKNVAAHHWVSHGSSLPSQGVQPIENGDDVWACMFAAAQHSSAAQTTELSPFWVYPGPAKIERYVPAIPLSRDTARLAQLRRSAAAYRLVFGQPRQEDLVAFLSEHFQPDELKELVDELRIDLSPEPIRGSLDPTSP